MPTFGSKFRWMAVGVVAALIVGAGAATAVMASGSDDGGSIGVEITVESTPTTNPDDTTDTTLPVATTATTVTTAGGTPLAEDATESEARYWGAECGEGPPTNHGQYVSSQDKGGAARRDAAQSDCGMPMSSIGEDPGGESGAPAVDSGEDADGDEGTTSGGPPASRGNSSPQPGSNGHGKAG